MSQIKAVYFDLGGVIVRTEDTHPRASLGASLGLSYEQIAGAVFEGGRDGSAARATRGEISEEQHWRNVVRALGLPESESEHVREAFFAGDHIDWDIVNFLRGLRKTHKTGLISNAWSGLRPWMARERLDDAFDTLVISAELGIAKPAEGIFRHALEQLGAAPEEAIFVDDALGNVEASRALGMHGVHFRSAEAALAEVKDLLSD
jgi:HAD superfamily hydrolase (TIGR01509 family)